MTVVKRILLSAALMAMLSIGAAAPAFGQAYAGEPGLDCTEGVVVGDHFRPNSSPAVYVDGELVGRADVDNDGTFRFQLPLAVGPGRLTITVAGVSVRLACPQPILGTVIRPPQGTAFTGGDVALLTFTAAALLAAGVLFVRFGGRRRRAEVQVGGDGSRT